jgi:catechol 2,3-dioxygenase-like lactoylglutathione lyase family enzyme
VEDGTEGVRERVDREGLPAHGSRLEQRQPRQRGVEPVGVRIDDPVVGDAEPHIRPVPGSGRVSCDLDHAFEDSLALVGADEWDWTRIVVDHVEVSASDYAESVRFYETVLAPLGIPRISETDEWTCFTNLNVVDRTPATAGLHLCFHARSRQQVDSFHAAGVEAGFRSNGAPGYRDYGPGYYAAYLLDPDGNNVEALYRDEGNPGYGVGVW